jgi:predicted RNase H-like HicB family nuclease
MTYTAAARLVGGWWAITVSEIPGVFSQARRLDQVEDMAREALALFLDAAPDSFDIVVQRGLPAEARGKGGRGQS